MSAIFEMPVRQSLVQRWYEEGFYGQQTLADVIVRAAEQYPGSYLALESADRPGRVALDAAVRQSRLLAGALYRLGIRKDDVVAVQLPNWIDAALIAQAVWLLDAVLLPITSIYDCAELEYILDDAGAQVLFVPGCWRGRDYRDVIAPLRARTGVREYIVLDAQAPAGATGWNDFLALGDEHLPLHAARADDICALIYTSGTTSKPKGVMHTHNSLISEARAGQPFWGEHHGGNHLSPWPFGHIAALMPLLRWWLFGVNTVLADRWEPELVARLIERHRIASTTGVPYFLSSLLDAAERNGTDISSLRNYGTGATNVPPAVVERGERRGIHTYRIYGSTEHPTVTAGLPHDPLEKRIRTDGRCLPGSHVRIVDDAGRDVATGGAGEIVTIGPEQFAGYRQAEHNAAAFLADGWFRTGDIGTLDADGYLTITDRKKDIIIRGGENISSREVEEALGSHPAIAESAAIAMPDARLGEKVCAFVVLREGCEIDLDAVSAHFRTRGIARQKTPEKLVCVDSLPRTTTGKVQKHLLRERVRQQKTADARDGAPAW